MFASQATDAAAHSFDAVLVVIFAFSAFIVTFWRVILHVVIAILAVALIAAVLSGCVVIASFMHR